MVFTSELAQYIVDYTSKITEYTVNIMDSDAVIIASTDPRRIGEFHAGAKKVLLTGRPYLMSEEEAQSFPNVVPGISLPICFHNQTIGVIGIGAGKNADTVGRLIQCTTELLIEQFHLKESISAEEQVLNEFLTHLLTESWHNNEFYFQHQLKLHNLDQSQVYLVVLMEFPSHIIDSYRPDSTDSAIVHYERNINHIIETMKHRLSRPRMLTAFIPNSLIFLVPYQPGEVSQDAFLSKFISDLDFISSQTVGSGYRISIGGFSHSMTNIHAQYRHALASLKITKKTHPEEQISSFMERYFEYVLLSIPPNKRRHYHTTILGPLETNDEKNVWLQTLECYFKNNQSITKTAEDLFIHRNTLLFRFQRIQQLTGFHPQRFQDAVTLYSAILLQKLKDTDDLPDSPTS